MLGRKGQNVLRISPETTCLIYSTWLRLAPFLPWWGPRMVSILPNQTVTYQWNNQEKLNNIVQSNRSNPFTFRPKFWFLLRKVGLEKGIFWKWNGKFRSNRTDQSKPSTTSGVNHFDQKISTLPESFHLFLDQNFLDILAFAVRDPGVFSCGIRYPRFWNPEFCQNGKQPQIFLPSFISAFSSLCRYIPLLLLMQVIKSFINIRLAAVVYSPCACSRWSIKIAAFVILLPLFKDNRFSLFLVFQSNYEAAMLVRQ